MIARLNCNKNLFDGHNQGSHFIKNCQDSVKTYIEKSDALKHSRIQQNNAKEETTKSNRKD